jgi:predicted nucleic acid-binding protein
MISPYVQDSHKLEFLRRLAKRPAVWLTPFHKSEVANAIFLHVFYKKLKTHEASRAWTEFLEDIRAGVWIPVEYPSGAWGTSIELATRYGPTLGVRTLDSLHVACALELRVDKFWTFDERQKKLAAAAGLDTAA